MDYELSKQSDKFLRRLSKNDKQATLRILNKIEEIIKDPYSFEFLTEDKHWRKARVGQYRIIYSIIDDRNVCFILLIDNRKTIYKKFNKII